MSVCWAQDWSVRYPTRKAWALNRVNLRIEPGQRVLILGASGSGKSTLLRALAGLLPEGVETRGQLNTPLPRAVGMVFHDPSLGTVLGTVGSDLGFGLENDGVPAADIDARCRSALIGQGLDLELDHPMKELSGGQHQRIVLAGVLARAPQLIVMDEPTAMLDTAASLRLIEQVRTLDPTLTVVISEHRYQPWLDVVDRVIVLGEGGVVVADTTPRQLHDSERSLLTELGLWLPEQTELVLDPPPHGQVRITADDVRADRNGFWRRARKSVGPFTGTIRDGLTYLTGENGSGKTTVGYALTGIIPVRTGLVLVTDYGNPYRWRARQRAARLGVLAQHPASQFVGSTVQDDLSFALRRNGWTASQTRKRVGELLEQFSLSALAGEHPHRLSGGQQRRLALASAIVAKPVILFADEPTLGQDQSNWLRIRQTLAASAQDGTCVLVATHDQHLMTTLPGEILRLAPRNTSQAESMEGE